MGGSVYRNFHGACLEFIADWQGKSWDAQDHRKEELQQPQQQQPQQQQQPFKQPTQQQHLLFTSLLQQQPQPHGTSIFGPLQSSILLQAPFQPAQLYTPQQPATPNTEAQHVMFQEMTQVLDANTN